MPKRSNTLSDSTLACAMKEDPEAMQKVVEIYYERCMNYLVFDLKYGYHQSKDIVQETFMRITEHLQKYDRKRARLVSYLFLVIRDRWRKEIRYAKEGVLGASKMKSLDSLIENGGSEIEWQERCSADSKSSFSHSDRYIKEWLEWALSDFHDRPAANAFILWFCSPKEITHREIAESLGVGLDKWLKLRKEIKLRLEKHILLDEGNYS